MKFLLLFFMSLAMSVSTLAKTNFVYCSEGSPSIFNPQLATDGATFNASSRTIYNRLVDFEYGGTKVVPSLASAWSVSKDGKTYTFDLRKNVEFHTTDYFTPTRKFSADDVLFTFNRMRLKDHSFHNVSNGTYTYFNAMGLDKLILDIKKISDYKVSFILKNQDATFLPNLAMDFASILSKEYGDLVLSKKTPQQIDLKPIGTGPFVFKKYVKDSLVRFFSFDKYFKGKPKIDNLIFSINTEASVRYQKLKTGECHFVTGPSPVDLEKMKADKNIKVLSQDGLNIGFLAMNVQKKPLDNLNVRRAIHHALNRESYIKAIFHNNATIAKNPLPPSMWSYNKEIKDLEFDISKAKDYLEKAGLKNGFEIDLWVPTISRPYNPDGKKMGEMIQADRKSVV